MERLLHSIKSKLRISSIDDETKDEIKYIFRKFIINAKQQCDKRHNKFIHRTLSSLSHNPKIKMCKFDKGKGVAVLNSEDYYAKLDVIVKDTSKFVEINTENQSNHPIIAKERSIAYYIRKYLKEFGEETVKNLIPSGSTPGKLYGLIKIHKEDNPARPVVSMIGTPEYKLAKFLDTIIKPYIPNKYVINSTDDFLTHIKDFSFTSNQFLVSFDAKSLFNNVPLNYTIDIIADYIFSLERKDQPPIKREIFIKLMHLATQGMFLYNNKLYKQIDGVAMGSPLGCTLANFFLGHLETVIFKQPSSSHPKMYLRYVDDVFAVFDDEKKCDSFLSILNTQHKNLQFTVEKSAHTLQFLDVDMIEVNEQADVDTWGMAKAN